MSGMGDIGQNGGLRIDLRSDFAAPPTPAMLDALTAAAAAPMGFGLREDSAQRELEARGASLLGFEDALLFPTCTMANLVAVLLQVGRGERLLLEADSHMALSEAGGAASIAGAVLWPLPGRHGAIPLELIAGQLEIAADAQRPRVALVAVENTHNRAGGVPLPLGHVAELAALAGRHGAVLHVDGSRLFNAAVADGVAPAALVAGAGTVSVSLNKGLAAPNGALLAGSGALIGRAVALRQQLGGGIRPAGMLAAAGLAALDRIGELAADHALARQIAEQLALLPICRIDPRGVRTNIVMVDLPLDAEGTAALVKALAVFGILVIAMAPGRVRLCTHRGVPADAPARVAAAFDSATRALAGQVSKGEISHV